MKEKEPVSSNTKQFTLRVLAPPSLLSAAAAMPQNLAESVVLLSRAPPLRPLDSDAGWRPRGYPQDRVWDPDACVVHTGTRHTRRTRPA
jgi:hypothetical protein|eukprot:COSAG03_NODE_355_length_8649_cov_96.396491_3_plen_89_part_00